jgi:hypothetical protein
MEVPVEVISKAQVRAVGFTAQNPKLAANEIKCGTKVAI